MRKSVVIILAVLGAAFLLGFSPGVEKRPPQSGAWTAIGPYGGEIRGLARNPRYANELYAGANGFISQFYKSGDNGLRWTRTCYFKDYISDVGTDGRKGEIVYVLTRKKLYKSSDRGESFPESLPLPAGFQSYQGRIAVHPSNSKVVFIGGYYHTSAPGWTACPAVCKSSDGGRTWTLIKLEPPGQNGSLCDIAIHPKNPNIIYLCGDYATGSHSLARIYKSVNGGASFAGITQDSIFNVSNSGKAGALAVHPVDPNTVFVAHSRGVARSSNGGVSWQNQSTPAPSVDCALNVIALDKAKPNTLYALAESGLAFQRGCWKSADGGKTWKRYANGFYGSGLRLLVSGNTILAGSMSGVFKSANAGAAWKPSHDGIQATNPKSFAVAPSSGSTLYTEVADFALFKTTNGGATWTKCPDFYRCDSILGFVVHPSNPKTLYLLAGG